MGFNCTDKSPSVSQAELDFLVEAFRRRIQAQEYIRNNVDMQENGVAFILDAKGAGLAQLRQFGVQDLRRVLSVMLDGVPIRIRAAHFVNLPRLFIPLLKLGLKLVKEKIRKRVHIHYNLESLHEALNKEFLPASLGGDLSNEDAAERHVVDRILKDDIPLEIHAGIDVSTVN